MDGKELYRQYVWGERDFRYLHLSGVDLCDLNLSHADFRGTDLYGAKFCRSNLQGIIFNHETNLDWVILDDTDLTEASLTGVNLSTASLQRIRLTNAVYDERTQFPYNFDAAGSGALCNPKSVLSSTPSSAGSAAQDFLLGIQEFGVEAKTAMAAYVQGRHEEALVIVDKLLSESPSNPYFHLIQGNLYSCMDQLDMAYKAYQRVLNLTDNSDLIQCASLGLERINSEQ